MRSDVNRVLWMRRGRESDDFSRALVRELAQELARFQRGPRDAYDREHGIMHIGHDMEFCSASEINGHECSTRCDRVQFLVAVAAAFDGITADELRAEAKKRSAQAAREYIAKGRNGANASGADGQQQHATEAKAADSNASAIAGHG